MGSDPHSTNESPSTWAQYKNDQWALPHTGNYWSSFQITSGLSAPARASASTGCSCLPRAAPTPGKRFYKQKGRERHSHSQVTRESSCQQLLLKDRREAGVSKQTSSQPQLCGNAVKRGCF